MPKKPPLYPHVPKSKPSANSFGGEKAELKRLQGQIVEVGVNPVKVVALPDWSLDYVEYPPGEREKYRNAFARTGIRICKVTSRRIYFEQ